MVFDTKVGGYELLDEAARLIKEGEIVVFPTETVYGLGADATNEEAVKKIFAVKNRPSDNPFIVHVPSIEAIDKVAYINEDAKRLFEAFSPGPITIVLPKKSSVPQSVTAGLDTVGIRIPAHPMALQLLDKCNCPIAAPSANTSKRVSPTKACYAMEDLSGKIPLILNGGDCDVGIESTVISLTTEIPTILRPGAITMEMLSKYLPKIINHKGEVVVAASPGMKYTHYAPIVPTFMFHKNSTAEALYKRNTDKGKKVVVLVKKSNLNATKDLNSISMGETPQEIAHNIFSLLRECEKQYDVILVQALSNEGVEGSVMNRLIKSCRGMII